MIFLPGKWEWSSDANSGSEGPTTPAVGGKQSTPGRRRLHPYPLWGGFLSTEKGHFYAHKYLNDREYWYQFSEWKEREHSFIKFSSIRQLYELGTRKEHEWLFPYYGEKTKLEQAKRVHRALKWWKGAMIL